MKSIFESSYFYIALWMTCSCTMILFNKAILSTMDFPFPMFMTTWHMILSTGMTQVLSRSTDLLPGIKQNKVDSKVLWRQIFPVAVCFALSLTFSNLVYLYLSVSYIQMLKAFTPVCVLFFSTLAGLQQTTSIEINIVLIICVGVALTSVGELNFSLTGFVLQLLGVVFESGRLVLTNVFMKDLGLDSLSTLYYVAPVCGALIGCACIAFEAQHIPMESLLSFNLWFIFVANGIVSVALNISSVMLIKHTSALTLTLSGVVKDILLVLLSLAIFKSPVSVLQYLGYSVSLLALNLHKEYKQNSTLFLGPQATTSAPTSAPTSANTSSTTSAAATSALSACTGEDEQPLMGKVAEGDETA